MIQEAARGGLFLAALFSMTLAAAQEPSPRGSGVISPAANGPGFPLLFEENRGRYGEEVRYHVEHDGGVILVTDRSIIFRDEGRDDMVLEFPGSAPDRRVAGESRSPTLVHYLVGKERDWRTDVPTFRRLRYRDLWPGIDLVLRGERGAVKYEFHVAPGADPARIRMRHVGARLTLDAAGGLEVRDQTGVRRRDPAPVAFQTTRGAEEPVAAAFRLDMKHGDTVGFAVGPYDRTRPLVIDPAFLVYCGYLPAGFGAYDLAVDASGRAIVVGYSERGDASIIRIRRDGVGLDFVTYIGGSGGELAFSVAVDAQGIYLCGNTTSDESSFPVTVGPDLTFNSKSQLYLDGFVCKLAHDGKTIVYCGYVGGRDNDSFAGTAVDRSGSVWLVGDTGSTDFPVKGGPQLKMPGPVFTGCVTKVAPDGRSLVFSGYLGGANGGDRCFGVAVDASGDGYVTGLTGSDERSFPVTVGPLTVSRGSPDTFLTKIDGRTGRILYSGFIGGAGGESPWDVAVDAQGAAYVVGQTFSDERSFPVVGGPFGQYTPSQRGDGFLAKVAPGGTGFVYSGFLGGFVAEGVAVDAQGRCYLGGNVFLPYQPVKVPVGGALSKVPGGSFDGFLARLQPDGRTFDYAGYLGGAHQDYIRALSLGPRDIVHVTGFTLSKGTFPILIGPSLVFSGRVTPPLVDAPFAAKIAEASIVPGGTGRVGTSVVFTLQTNDDAGLVYQAGTSLGAGPIPLGSRSLGLSADDLLAISVGGRWPSIFEGYTGRLDPNGMATAKLHIPSVPALVGVRLHTAFVTLDPLYPLGVKSISDTASLAVVP